jgi:hypothetical protein
VEMADVPRYAKGYEGMTSKVGWWEGLGGRRCSSPNHRWRISDLLRSRHGAFWRCPRCGHSLCTICEGGDIWEVCDECLSWILKQKGNTKHFNSYSACMATDIEHLTQLVMRWRT